MPTSTTNSPKGTSSPPVSLSHLTVTVTVPSTSHKPSGDSSSVRTSNATSSESPGETCSTVGEAIDARESNDGAKCQPGAVRPRSFQSSATLTVPIGGGVTEHSSARAATRRFDCSASSASMRLGPVQSNTGLSLVDTTVVDGSTTTVKGIRSHPASPAQSGRSRPYRVGTCRSEDISPELCQSNSTVPLSHTGLTRLWLRPDGGSSSNRSKPWHGYGPPSAERISTRSLWGL